MLNLVFSKVGLSRLELCGGSKCPSRILLALCICVIVMYLYTGRCKVERLKHCWWVVVPKRQHHEKAPNGFFVMFLQLICGLLASLPRQDEHGATLGIHFSASSPGRLMSFCHDNMKSCPGTSQPPCDTFYIYPNNNCLAQCTLTYVFL